jgi:hypothetical protein
VICCRQASDVVDSTTRLSDFNSPPSCPILPRFNQAVQISAIEEQFPQVAPVGERDAHARQHAGPL